MWLFDNYPKVDYVLLDNNQINATDITKRFKFVEKVLQNKYILFKYVIRENERPGIVAQRYYKDETLDWLILITNKIIDPYFEWPMSNREFNDYIKKKYGSIPAAKTTYAKYYKIFQKQTTTYDGFQVPEKKFEIDQAAYQMLVDSERERVTNYNYELQKNEARKQIKVIEKSFIPQILKEAEKIYGTV
jgi:hypothetical protein